MTSRIMHIIRPFVRHKLRKKEGMMVLTRKLHDLSVHVLGPAAAAAAAAAAAQDIPTTGVSDPRRLSLAE